MAAALQGEISISRTLLKAKPEKTSEFVGIRVNFLSTTSPLLYNLDVMYLLAGALLSFQRHFRLDTA